MAKLKLWFEQCVIVSFAILAGVVLEGLLFHWLYGDTLSSFYLDWYQLLSIVMTGIVCGIPTILLLDEDTLKRIPFILKVILHCILTYLVVAGIGKVFSWYTKLSGFIMMTIIFVLVYVFVWVSNIWLHKQDEKKINQALEDLRDEE